MSKKRNNTMAFVLTFLAGVVLALLAVFVWTKQQDRSAQQTESAVQVSAGVQADTAAVGSMNAAEVFPSWNPESASLQELVDFVNASLDESGPDYLEPAERVAVFDMDGTILSEKAPIYFDYCMTMYRVLDDPTYSATEEERDAMQQVRDHAYATGEKFYPKTITKHDLVASAFAGMTPEEFRAWVLDFADHADALGFEGMTYSQTFYKPMTEVIDYLRANGYDVWIVSACEREVVRALVSRLGIQPDHVIATDVPYVASGKGDEAADDYNMGKEEAILLGAPLEDIECGKSEKSAAIARELGKRPVLAFGNSSGDYSMLNYAEGNPEHSGMGFLVVCDDTEREYGSDEKAAGYYDEAEKQGWTAVSMADDWLTIYGDGVRKTKLPGAAEALQEAA
ncbi:MAG: haloacid dehalogenase-like hydrolase [Oscillospiraceae bacterium]|nr:haloacid dehalogenase-like hydrolase [Oscillospiraceae bacterium]